MSEFIPNSPRRDSRSFQKIVDAFLGGEGLPFAGVLASERIERVFRKHGCWFGLHGVYTTAITVWSFLSQVLRDGKEAACQAAVARVVSYCQLQGLQTPTEDKLHEHLPICSRIIDARVYRSIQPHLVGKLSIDSI